MPPTAGVETSSFREKSPGPGLPVVTSKLDLRGRRVLVVDDDRLNARILISILKPAGYQVAEAGSAETALELYASFAPDLVLLDVVLPGMNGFEACRQLKAAYGDACAPIIFITAKRESEDVVEGLAAGGVDYLPKPFRPKEVIERIRVHLHNRLLIEEQQKLVAQLSSANAAKNRLLGMAAHDLRNPLASIRGLADFLRDGTVGPLAPDQLDLVNTIHEASESMLGLVNEFLDFSVIESGELKINATDSSLSTLLTKWICLNNINAARKGTRIELRLPPADRSCRLDADKIKQVVDNLVSNAVKFSPPASVIEVRADYTDTHCTVVVRDQGPGIPAGESHKLFKDFSVTSVKPTAGEKSTGLGLAICRKIVEAHRGSITADNHPAGGAVFTLSLPLT
jgi:two-component system, sensor histidine kinase and response regulator